MLRNGLVAEAYPDVDAGMTRTYLADGGVLEPITAVATSKDGGKSTFVIADETHLWVDPRLKRLHATLTRNITKRRIANGWLLETSTMYAPGEGSVAEETHRVAKGMAGVLFDHREAPEVDLADDEALARALAEVYGPAAAWMDIDQIIQAEFRDPTKRESDSRRYWLNQPWTIEEKFVTAAQWDACADPRRAIPPGSRVVLALDGSFNNDTTGVVVASLDERPHLDVVGCWRRPDNAPAGWEIDVLAVEEAVRQAAKRWQVVELAADPYRWTRTLQLLADEGIPTVVFPQTTARMTPATRSLYDAVTTLGLSHSGDPRLREHMLNAVLKNDSRGYRLAKPTKDSPYRVDLAICAVMALDRARTLGADRGPMVWSIREVMEELRAKQAAETEPERPDPRQIPTMAEDDDDEPPEPQQPPVVGARFIPLAEMPIYDPWRIT
jgi:phage terminase large subunit-like protein